MLICVILSCLVALLGLGRVWENVINILALLDEKKHLPMLGPCNSSVRAVSLEDPRVDQLELNSISV